MMVVHGFRCLQHVAICLSRRRVIMDMSIRMGFRHGISALYLDWRRVTCVNGEGSVRC